MKALALLAAVAAAASMAGCKPADIASAVAAHHGRYLGIGVYPAGVLWAQIVAGAPKVSAAATLKDDEQVIVVVDSKTGEIRQCGNFSGYCVAMDPWSQALAQGRTAPLPLIEHAEDLERDAAKSAAAKP